MCSVMLATYKKLYMILVCHVAQYACLNRFFVFCCTCALCWYVYTQQKDNVDPVPTLCSRSAGVRKLEVPPKYKCEETLLAFGRSLKVANLPTLKKIETKKMTSIGHNTSQITVQ